MRKLHLNSDIIPSTNVSYETYKQIINRKQYDVLTPDEEYEYFRQIKNGNKEHYVHVIKANLRFVIRVAQVYKRQYPEVEIMDMIQRGNTGLVRGAHMFDETKGFKLISYAVRWIREHIMKGIRQTKNKTLVIKNLKVKEQEIFGCYSALSKELGHPPTPEMIHEETGYDVELIIHIIYNYQQPVSLQEPTADADSKLREEVLSGPTETPYYFQEDGDERRKQLLKILKGWFRKTPLQYEVLRLYFGFHDEPFVTTSLSISRLLGITEEDALKIRNTAMSKLRSRIKKYPEEAHLLKKLLIQNISHEI